MVYVILYPLLGPIPTDRVILHHAQKTYFLPSNLAVPRRDTPWVCAKTYFFYRRLPVLQQCRGGRCYWCECRRKCRRRHPLTITAFTHTPTCDRCLGNCLPPLNRLQSLFSLFCFDVSPPVVVEEEEEIRPFPKRPGGISLLLQPRLEN